MAYEELTVYAIQDESMKAFANRYRIFSSKNERDLALDFMKEHLDAPTASMRHPVKMKVFVYGEEDNQLKLDMDKTG